MKNIKVKICGIKNVETALIAEQNGADYIGLVFCQKSKRCISINKAKEIILALNNKSSVPCLKIQQDNVDTFIEKCFGKVSINY